MQCMAIENKLRLLTVERDERMERTGEWKLELDWRNRSIFFEIMAHNLSIYCTVTIRVYLDLTDFPVSTCCENICIVCHE